MSLSCVQYEEVADKDDLMGVEDTAKKDILSPSVCVCVCVQDTLMLLIRNDFSIIEG